jgi:hypothetical protein
VNLGDFAKDLEDRQKDRQKAEMKALTRAFSSAKPYAQLFAEALIEISAARVERESQKAAEQEYPRAVHRGIERAAGASTQPEAAPVPKEKKQPKKRASWRTELPYIAKVYNASTKPTQKQFWTELRGKAGTAPSPFIKGNSFDQLVVKDTGATLKEHTLATNMPLVRIEAAKLKKPE